MGKYNESVRDTYGLNKTAGEVGIEIEMEGRGFHQGPIDKYWEYHRDGSLRGEESAEYVLATPINRDIVPKALEVLFSFLKKNGTRIRKDSPNTSVHIHLNMQEWSIKKVYNLICLWYIFEKTLTDWCGEERAGNLFCLRGSDAEVSLMRLASAVRYSRYANLADQDGLRYAALNYTALSKFGSLEFRSLAGVYEEEVINTWIRLLLSLKDYSERFVCPSDLIVEMSRLGHQDFFRSAFPNDLWKVIDNKDIQKQMQEGMRLIQGVAYAVNWDRDNEVKKKVRGEGEVGSDWRGMFIPADEPFPGFRPEWNQFVNDFVRMRDAHELRRERWEANRGLEFEEVVPHPMPVAQPGDPDRVVAPRIRADRPRERVHPGLPNGIIVLMDRNGVGRDIPRDGIPMTNREGNERIWVEQGNVLAHINEGWTF